MSAKTTGRCLIDRAHEAEVTRKEPIIGEAGKLAGKVTGFRRVPDGKVRAFVEVWVDAEALFSRLANKAIRSKTGKAQALHGAVVVIARNRKGGATTSKG
jgi:hypothetical protein